MESYHYKSINFPWYHFEFSSLGVVYTIDCVMGKKRDHDSIPTSREGYQVGVFKGGRLKKIMKMKEATGYLRHKAKKIKEDRPKRECSEKQLQALAKGREIREKNRSSSSSSSSGAKAKPVKTRTTSAKNAHFGRESENQGHRKRAEKARVRRKKEDGKYRGGDDQYNSDSANSSFGSGEESE